MYSDTYLPRQYHTEQFHCPQNPLCSAVHPSLSSPLPPPIFASQCNAQSLSHIQLFETPWNIPARLLSPWDFSRQENWHGLPFPSPEDLPDPGIKLMTPALADSLPLSLLRSQFFTVTIILPFPECHVIGISVCSLFRLAYFTVHLRFLFVF